MKLLKTTYFFLGIILLLGCGAEEVTPEVRLLSIRINGATFTDDIQEIPVEATIVMSFSSILNPTNFEEKLSVTSSNGKEAIDISYSNSTSKATLTIDLEYEKTYTLNMNAGVIGENGEELTDAINLSFTTTADNVIRSMPPCTNPSECLESVQIVGSEGEGTFEFYSNYPIYEENAQWENLTQAVIVVHGASHNPEDYYSYMTNTLNAENLSESTVLIAPYFKDAPTSSNADFYWSSTGWRDGKQSNNSNQISSFTAVDELIKQLADSEHFPVLDQIVVVGQSSGGRFVHLYAPANEAEGQHTNIAFDYIVSESQYFYYPDSQRIDENTNSLYVPTNCSGYVFWPFGYQIPPEYLANTSATDFNQRFVERSITYLLGNGSGSDALLNTSNCSATLLGASRFRRGENMFDYMEMVYPGTHNHSKVIANGILHDGSAILQSPEFKNYLKNLLN